MRDEFQRWVTEYPTAPGWRDPGFAGSPTKRLIDVDLPAAIVASIPEAGGRFRIQGSAGKGSWTHTPWIALMDPAVTASVEEGFYIVYLLSLGGERLYLTLNQGCTTLKDSVGMSATRRELQIRAEAMRARALPQARRLRPIKMDLGVAPTVWRGRLYELGVVAGVAYDTDRLPLEDVLVADLREALALYHAVRVAGGWEAEDDLIRALIADDAGQTLQQAKQYRQHRSIERQPSHSRKVKKALGTRCMGCQFELHEIYGDIAADVIDAHHLVPLATLEDDEVVHLDPAKDFAVLCPNCHRVIHRLDDPSDLSGLKASIARGALSRQSKVTS